MAESSDRISICFGTEDRKIAPIRRKKFCEHVKYCVVYYTKKPRADQTQGLICQTATRLKNNLNEMTDRGNMPCAAVMKIPAILTVASPYDDSQCCP